MPSICIFREEPLRFECFRIRINSRVSMYGKYENRKGAPLGNSQLFICNGHVMINGRHGVIKPFSCNKIPKGRSSVSCLSMRGTLGNNLSDSLMQHSRYFIWHKSWVVTDLSMSSPKISFSSLNTLSYKPSAILKFILHRISSSFL